MREHTIDHPHNEASALIAIHDRRLLERFGWDVAFWIVSDEAPAHEAIAALGRRRKKRDKKRGGWEVVRLRIKSPRGKKNTDDCEAMARAGAWIYVFGSQYGAKDGPLDAKRHFVARFNESLVEPDGKKRLGGKLEVARRPFVLHRIVNDALRKAEIDVIADGKHVRKAFIEETRKGAKHGKRLRKKDHPINVEGATFLPNGRLLLGLRYPVSEGGHPILVEVDGIDRLFERKGVKAACATRVWTLRNVGKRRAPSGIRELDQQGLTIHAITGGVERSPEDSEILRDHPEGQRARCEHWVFDVPEDDAVRLKAKRVRRFSRKSNVEGFALFEDGCVWYAHDDNRIRLSESRAGRRR